MANVAASSKDPVAPKKQCPNFEAGFLHVESTNDFGGTAAAVEALRPKESIFTDMKAPHLVLDNEEYQYVNFEKPLDELRDDIPGENIKFAADRMGQKPRILVRFDEQKVFKFKLKLIPDADNLNYYDDEVARNPDHFTQVLDSGKEYSTNAKGYLIIEDDFILGAVAGNKYTIEVEVTEDGYEGTYKKHFINNGVLKTARYLWMLAVTGGKDGWVPTHSHADCLAPTIGLYNGDPCIHINSKRLVAQHIPEFEYLEDYKSNDWDFIKGIFLQFLANAKDTAGAAYPPSMRNYILIGLYIRFVYERVPLTVKGKIPLDGNKHDIPIIGGALMSTHSGSKAYLRYAKGTYPELFGTANVDLRGYTQAVDGINKDNIMARNGHIGCRKLEIDTSALPKTGVVMDVKITCWGIKRNVIAGKHWSDHSSNSFSGFFIFSGQKFRPVGGLFYSPPLAIAHIVSHELGHAIQMTTDGHQTKPNKIASYYDSNEPNSIGLKYSETRNHNGPHCLTGFIPGKTLGTCLMYGQVNSPYNPNFCSSSEAAKSTLINAKKNDCTMAVRKVSLNEPFTWGR